MLPPLNALHAFGGPSAASLVIGVLPLLAQTYLQQGRLIVFSEMALPLGQDYQAVYPYTGRRSDQVKEVLKQLSQPEPNKVPGG